ncbi:MAG: N-acetyltransferase [Planctomycetaceae bacterium]|nr:MAG: N-acetyltransferase [Planctomycetaceae bacterium]
MQTQAVIRKATRRDLDAIVALAQELMDFHKARDPFFTRSANFDALFGRFALRNIRSKAACVLVATLDERIVGYCQGMLDRHPPSLIEPGYGLILDLCVTAGCRRTGIGEQMFKAMRDWFCMQGVRRIEVRHSTFNRAAARFWPKMGFTPYLRTLFLDL